MKTALVTGGSRGIGRAVSIKLASEGYHVLINYLSNSEAADQTFETITKSGGSAEFQSGYLYRSIDQQCGNQTG
jgi:3-oxoacyl-[acyl-carrier protein] reductase